MNEKLKFQDIYDTYHEKIHRYLTKMIGHGIKGGAIILVGIPIKQKQILKNIGLMLSKHPIFFLIQE